MCILMLCKPGACPTRADLVEACLNNPDGFGFALHRGRSITRYRGMDAEKVIDSFLRQRATTMEYPAMFHARIGTHGPRTKENCHPFRVGGDDRLVLGHNGILPAEVLGETAAPYSWSDTRAFAEDFFPQRGFSKPGSNEVIAGIAGLDDPEVVAMWEDWAGGNNKLGFLSTHPKLGSQWYIIGERQGTWDADVWYSNDSHRPRWWEEYLAPKRLPVDYCAWCGRDNIGWAARDGYCGWCDSCAECGEDVFSQNCICDAERRRMLLGLSPIGSAVVHGAEQVLDYSDAEWLNKS